LIGEISFNGIHLNKFVDSSNFHADKRLAFVIGNHFFHNPNCYIDFHFVAKGETVGLVIQ